MQSMDEQTWLQIPIQMRHTDVDVIQTGTGCLGATG